MLITELITAQQQQRRPVVAGYTLLNTRHIFARAQERGIPLTAITTILKRLGRARKFIDAESPSVNRGVSLYDSKTGVHLIVKKLEHSDSNELALITVYVNRNYQGVTPVFRVR